MTKRLLLHIGLSFAFLLCSELVQAEEARGQSVAAVCGDISIPNTRRLEFVSKINGHRYVVKVALPFGNAPANGYAALYILNDGYFGSATELARGLTGVVVVGIGYPDDPAYLESVIASRGPIPAWLSGSSMYQSVAFLEGRYDFTLPVTDSVLAAENSPGPRLKHENVGGVDDFLKTIEVDVKPRVEALVPIDVSNQALFGHSLSGLATLHALFTEPNAFRTFIVASPSIWWGNKEVLADERAFAAAVGAGKTSPRVLITIGSEEDHPAAKVPAGYSRDELIAIYRRIRPIENACELATRLKALRGRPGFEAGDCEIFDKQGHGEAAWSALARGLPFAFRDQ